MAQFPNERPFTFEDAVMLGQSDELSEFEVALQDSPTTQHHSATWQDFDWMRAQVQGGAGDTFVIARPKNPQKHSVWVYDEANSQQWHENGDWDPNTNALDLSRVPVVSAANAPGPTPLPGQQAAPGCPLPGQPGNQYIPGGGAPMRMTGRPEEKVDPGNVGKTKDTGFDDALDKLLGVP